MKNYHCFLLFITYLLFPVFVISQTNEQLENASKYAFEEYKLIHQFPELGKMEFKTSELIRRELEKFGFTDFFNVPALPTCVIACLDTKKEGTSIAFRAEIDARPGNEKSGLPYSSKIDSLTHSCGHDAHTAILLATAKTLFSIKKKLSGKIYFIFQPAEETKGGADDIVNSGILDQLGITNLFALHSTSGLSVGTISISPGYIMAGSNYFTIEIEGKSSHAATPFEGDNIPVLTGKIVAGITSIPALKMDVSTRPCVISVTYIQAGTEKGSNVIPAKSIIKGTIRAYEHIDSTFQNQLSISKILINEVQALSSTQGITANIKISKGSPPTYNSDSLFKSIIPNLSKSYSGIVDTRPFKGMFSEDFAFYTDGIECLYFGLGIAKDNLGYENVHSNEFSIHPDSFFYGIELFCDLAIQMSEK